MLLLSTFSAIIICISASGNTCVSKPAFVKNGVASGRVVTRYDILWQKIQCDEGYRTQYDWIYCDTFQQAWKEIMPCELIHRHECCHNNVTNWSDVRHLLAASMKGNQKEVDRLLTEVGVTANSTENRAGWSALMWAANSNSTGTVLQLLKCCANVNQKNNIGTTALLLSAKANNLDSVLALLKKGADPNIMNNYLAHPMLYASKYGNNEMVTNLIRYGAAVNNYDAEGNTPLHYASGEGWTNVIFSLLQAGAKIDATNDVGNTPLMMAASYGRYDAVDLLLSNRANTRNRNRNAKSALEMASQSGNIEIANLISQYNKISKLQ